MHNTNCLILAVVLIVLGLLGLMKGMKDSKNSKSLACPPKELKMRDDQYLFMSGVSLAGGLAMLLLCREKRGYM